MSSAQSATDVLLDAGKHTTPYHRRCTYVAGTFFFASDVLDMAADSLITPFLGGVLRSHNILSARDILFASDVLDMATNSHITPFYKWGNCVAWSSPPLGLS